MVVLIGSTPVAAAPVVTFLHEFALDNSEGANPSFTGQLAQGRDGNLYGTTPSGGSDGSGTAFKITPSGIFTKLHDFNRDVGDGYAPWGGLTLGTDGNFYGTSIYGRRNKDASSGQGNIFKMTPAGVVTVLHQFKQDGSEGSSPYAPPVQGRDGAFYGTTQVGGNGQGTIYRMTSTGAFSVLRKLDGQKAGEPMAPLIVGKDGNFYGTALRGGFSSAGGVGTVFKMTPAGAISVVYSFDGTHGIRPHGPLVQGTDGNFYGTTQSGGEFNRGTVFKLTPKGVITTLHSFGGDLSDGIEPTAGLVQGSDGIFYGATPSGGAFDGQGTLFSVTPAGAYSVLYRFSVGGVEPFQPLSTPFLHTNGRIYGLTLWGSNGPGAIYSLAVGAPQFIRPVPEAAQRGTSIGLLGPLSGTTKATFNDLNASFSGTGGTFRTAVVPAGAATGLIKATTTGGTRQTLKPFLQLPTLSNFSPTTGATGTSVVLTGTGLTQTTKVTFGGGKVASFVVNTDGRITVTVPVGAATGKIAVTTKGGNVSTATDFTVMP